jgi:hypothetical protein
MKKLLAHAESFHLPKCRPSGHDISKPFGSDNRAGDGKSKVGQRRWRPAAGPAAHDARIGPNLPLY